MLLALLAHAFAASLPDLSSRDTVSVLVLGDSGSSGGFPSVAAAAASVCFAPGRAPCDLAILLGDNVYEAGFTKVAGPEWRRSFARPMRPFVGAAKGDAHFRAWVTPGNHDWAQHLEGEGPSRIAAAIATTSSPANHAIGDLWQMPSLAYEVPGLPSWLHLHALDTQTLVKSDDRSLLDRTRAAMDGQSGWKVVFGHHPPVSSGGHGAAGPEQDDERVAQLLDTLRPVGLDLVFVGHDHHQEALVTGGVPVIVQGNSSKGRDVVETPYAACSRWKRGGPDSRGFAIATFRRDTVTIEFFGNEGESLTSQSFPVTPPESATPMGSCP